MYRFRLNSPTIAVRYCTDGRRAAVIIPDGAEVISDDPYILHDPDKGKLVTVQWDGDPVGIFLVDLQERGELTGRAGS